MAKEPKNLDGTAVEAGHTVAAIDALLGRLGAVEKPYALVITEHDYETLRLSLLYTKNGITAGRFAPEFFHAMAPSRVREPEDGL